MAEEKWQHLLVRVDTAPQAQLTLVPSQGGLQTSTHDASATNILAMLDELGGQGWQLVAVRESEYWMKRPAVRRDGQAYLDWMKQQAGEQ